MLMSNDVYDRDNIAGIGLEVYDTTVVPIIWTRPGRY